MGSKTILKSGHISTGCLLPIQLYYRLYHVLRPPPQGQGSRADRTGPGHTLDGSPFGAGAHVQGS